MLNAGIVLCHKCGRVTSDAYYYHSTYNVWVQLKRKPLGGLYVEHFVPEYSSDSKNVECKYSALNRAAKKDSHGGQDNFQHTIKVDLAINGGKKETVPFKRCCPFCAESGLTEILKGTGDLPTYVIGVTGVRQVGKSCWIHALGCAENQNAVNRFPYYLSSETVEDSSAPRIAATLINDKGKTKIITINKPSRKGGIPIAAVVVLDFAGEIFEEDKESAFEDSSGYALLSGTEGYSGLDAIVVMDAPGSSNVNDPRFVDAFNRAKEYGLLTGRPVAYVLNQADRLFANPPQQELSNMPEYQVPLFSKDSFRKTSKEQYAKDKLLRRIKLQTALSGRYSAIAPLIYQENPQSAGFFVKSTQPEEEGQMLNFKESINVMDPLIWILNELDIFPIDEPNLKTTR
ncbi:MAG: hypothetical protein IKJ74_05850 [Clostridia bacterium]|nr:hypothetical protein [Clostridia bacterium]